MLSESTLVSIWHPSDGAEGQGQGQLLIKTVKLAFSVTNNVIRLKPPSNVVSPLEQALTQHGMYRSLTSRAYFLTNSWREFGNDHQLPSWT